MYDAHVRAFARVNAAAAACARLFAQLHAIDEDEREFANEYGLDYEP